MLTITTGKVSDVGLLDHLTLPKPLRRVLFYDSVSCLELVFLTNRLDLSALNGLQFCYGY